MLISISRDCISQLTWKRLDIPLDELEDVSEMREKSGLFCSYCCPHDPTPDKQ